MNQQPTVTTNITLYLTIEYTPSRSVSVALLDQRKRTFQLTSFSDNEHYTNLQSLLIQTNPHERDDGYVVYVNLKTDIASEKQKIMAKLENCKHRIDQGKNSPNVQLALKSLLDKDYNLYLKILQDKKAVQALGGLLAVLQLQQDQTNKKKYQLKRFTFDKFMRLDQPVINALQIFPKDMEKKILAGNNTIFQILNKCKTHIGTRCLKRWMRQPLQNAQQINQRLDKVQFFLKNPSIKNSIQNQLKKLPDLDNLYYTFYKVKAGKKNNVEVNDLIKIYRTVHTMKQLLKVLLDKGSSHPQMVQTTVQIDKNIKIIDTVCKMIEQNIIMEGRDNQFFVKPNAQKQLTVISRQQQKLNTEIRQHIEKVQQQLGIDVQKLPSNTYKYVLQADKKKSIDKVKQNSEFKFLTAKQNKITFTTETLVSLCKNLLSLEQQYRQKQKQILTKMYNVVATYYPVMQQLSMILSQLDVLTTFSTVIHSSSSQSSPWSRPIFSTSLHGHQIHHPCVRTCIPNDCDLSGFKTVILTGPNMGGKSTYIRTVGLAVYLAHIGCYVPAKQFQTEIIDSIITRVGASDMQMKGISTFMSQMIQSITMLQSATHRSLVLIDELGRGTSTSQGFGIAWAICYELHTKIKPYCLFATHFHQMTKMAEQVEGVLNMYTSCKIDDNKLQLQYKVLPGKMQKSYGIQVAKMLNFPQQIIKDAQAYLELYEQKNEQMVEEENEIPLTEAEKQAIYLYKQMKILLKDNQNNKENFVAIQQKYRNKIAQILKAH